MAKARFDVTQLMNKASVAEVKKVQTERRTVMIPLDMIDPSPENRYSMDGIEDLAASIELVGLLQNLLVRQKPDGRYSIIAGHRRRAALQMLVNDGKAEFADVPCTPIRCDNDVMAELQLLMANSTTRVLTDTDKVYQAERIRDLLLSLKRSGYKFGMRMREVIAQMMGVSRTNAGRYESIIAHLSPEWRKLFDNNTISITSAYEISRRPLDMQAKMLEIYTHTGILSFEPVSPYQSKAAAEYTEPQEPPEPTKTIDTDALLAKADAIREQQRHGTARTDASGAAEIIESGMVNGAQSGAKIEAAHTVMPAVIHLVKANYDAILRGETVYFEEYGTGKRIAAKVEILGGTHNE